MRSFSIILLIVVTIFWGKITAQNDFSQPKLRFFKDSLKIGEPIKLSLVYEHKPSLEVLMPDSAFDYSPFEFISKQYFHTKTKKNLSKDSVIYTLSSFEIEPILSLALPVYIYQEGDTATVFSEDASIKFKEEIVSLAPNDSLRVNANLVLLNNKFNYPFIGIGLVILGIIALFVFIFFRKKIMARYNLYFIEKDYESFISKYEKLTKEYYAAPSVSLLEEQLSIWKKYLQKLEKTPYSTLTTKEIAKYLNQNQVTSSLQNYDKAIYGGYIKEDLTNSTQYLFEIAKLKFQSKQNELRNI